MSYECKIRNGHRIIVHNSYFNLGLNFRISKSKKHSVAQHS